MEACRILNIISIFVTIMALTLRFGISELSDSTGFVFVEQTGKYTVDNTGGWSGGGNANWSTGNFLDIYIFDTLGNVVGTSPTRYSYADFDSDPSDPTWPFPKLSVAASDYAETIFVDGVYRVQYKAYQSNGTTLIAETEQYIWFDSEIRTNLKNVLLSQPSCGCDSGAAYKWTVYQANDIAGFFLVESGNYTTAQEMNELLVTDTTNFCSTC